MKHLLILLCFFFPSSDSSAILIAIFSQFSSETHVSPLAGTSLEAVGSRLKNRLTNLMNATVTLKNHHFPTPWSLLFPSSFALASQACLLTSFQQSDDLCEQMASSSEILHMPCYIKPRLTRSYSQHDIIDFLSREIFGVFQAVMLAGTSKLISQISLDVNLFMQSISQHLIS